VSYGNLMEIERAFKELGPIHLSKIFWAATSVR